MVSETGKRSSTRSFASTARRSRRCEADSAGDIGPDAAARNAAASRALIVIIVNGESPTNSLPFKGRVRVGMGSILSLDCGPLHAAFRGTMLGSKATSGGDGKGMALEPENGFKA